MLLKTKHFGEIDIDEKGILTFNEGLPGFENVREFILIDNEETASPFLWLQCVNEPEWAFVVADPFPIKKDYQINISDDIVRSLEVEKAEDVKVYAIVVVPEDITRLSMNLKAPIIINTKNNMGAQVILDTDKYNVRHYISDELRKQEVEQDACSNQKKRTVNCNK